MANTLGHINTKEDRRDWGGGGGGSQERCLKWDGGWHMASRPLRWVGQRVCVRVGLLNGLMRVQMNRWVVRDSWNSIFIFTVGLLLLEWRVSVWACRPVSQQLSKDMYLDNTINYLFFRLVGVFCGNIMNSVSLEGINVLLIKLKNLQLFRIKTDYCCLKTTCFKIKFSTRK